MSDPLPRGPALPPLDRDPRVSAVLPVRNSAGTLPRAVASLLEQRPGVDEIVLAVGPSDDGTLEMARDLARRHESVRVVDNPGGAIPDGLNAAIGAASGDVLVRVDAHAVLPEGYVGAAVEALRRTGAANVGGRQDPAAESGFRRAVATAMRTRLGAGDAAYRLGRTAGPVDTVYLGVFRREALEAVGGFDPAFLRNQDAELNHRLRAAGHVVWLEPSLAVAYTPRGSVRALARQYYDYGRWRRLTARRHPASLRLRQLAAPTLVIGLTGAVAAGLVLGRPWVPGLATGAYALALLAGAASDARRPADVVPVATALVTMHLSWGVGFLIGPPRWLTSSPSHPPRPVRR